MRLLKRQCSVRGHRLARQPQPPYSPDDCSTRPLPIAAAAALWPHRRLRTASAAAPEGREGGETKMAVEMLDDDVFFAELSKQISLLITDEDDADVAAAAQFIPDVAAPLPGFGHHHVPPPQQRGASSMLTPPACTLFHHAAASYGDSRAWQQQQQKGTGVFIPRSTPSAGHHKKKGKNKGAAAKARAAGSNNAVAAGGPTKRRSA